MDFQSIVVELCFSDEEAAGRHGVAREDSIKKVKNQKLR